MTRFDATIPTLLWTLALAGCPRPVLPPIEWGRALPLHLPPGQRVAPALRPIAVADGKGKRIRPARHYVTLTVDRLRFHRVPAVVAGSEVVVALRVTGLGSAKSGAIRWLAGLEQAKGLGGVVELDPSHRIGPLPYGGGVPVIRVELLSVPAASVSRVKARLQGAAHLAAGAIQPGSRVAKAHRVAYASAVKLSAPPWSARLTLATLPETAGKRALVAGHHVFVLRRPRDKRKRFRPHLTLHRREVQWRKKRSAYEDSPYVVLTLARARRSPAAAEPVREQLQLARRLMLASPAELGKALARNGLARSRAEDSPRLTTWERDLWVAMARLQRAEIELLGFRLKKLPAATVKGLIRKYRVAADRLLDPRGRLRALLKSAEVRRIQMKRRDVMASQ